MAARKKTKGKKTVEQVKPPVLLTSIEVLVLKGLDGLGKLLLLRLLLAQNYLLIDADGCLVPEPLRDGHGMFNYFPSVNFLKFDHEHKLMRIINEEKAMQSNAISGVSVEVSTNTTYAEPFPNHPPELCIGNAVYIRVA